MKRREFLVAGSAGLTAGANATPAAVAPDWKPTVPPVAAPIGKKGKGRPKLGTQNSSDEAYLKILSGLGVSNICATLPSRSYDANWSVESLTKLRERVEANGISLDMIPLPLSSAYITKHEYPDIMKGESPQRDKSIEDICKMIRNCAKAGIPAMKYNMSILGVVRTAPSKGRGGSQLSTFKYAGAKQEPALTEAGPVPADVYWERITYFLERVVPVATEEKVRICCHPHDPGMPKGKGWRGVETVLGSVDGLKKFVSIKESPYHGLNFCQGTISEMLVNPAKEIMDVIRYFGTRNKIFNVHFRNIRGGFLDFQETCPDDGDVNMIQAARVYKEVGYSGMLMPDHVPHIEGDTRGFQAFAFAYGYIRAILQQLENEA
ncbi:mannonate dehydratase [Bryobacter aggregatus]|uniref:mannonate dehydratase n=1 Tax=Bryobacter aggregatus TaxID=360054 RepID=UPI0009B59FB0|nr:mannonate dehydratase [Bryobacter aggregatus]